MSRIAGALPVALALITLVPACASTSPAPTATPAVTGTSSPTPTSPPIPLATATPAQTALPTRAATSATPRSTVYPPGSVVVTFSVVDEEYRILVTDPTNIAIARRLLAGLEAPPIPNGRVVRGDPSVNVGWSWHIDPGSLEFADMTTEVCDGRPSFVEAGTITGDQFCPWSAKVIAVDAANT